MSSYIRGFEWERYDENDNWEDYYEELEEQDQTKIKKKPRKLREYEGYNETDGGD